MISKLSNLTRELYKVELIIQDKVPMQYKYCFEVVYCLFVDLQSTTDDVLFGGILALLSRDFIQILPIVPQGLQADIIKVYLQQSFVWKRLCKLFLRINMQVCNTTTADN